MASDEMGSEIRRLLEETVGSEVVDARSLSHLEGAEEAEDLHGIYRDLEFARDAVETLNGMMESSDAGKPEGEDTRVVERGLYTAALIAYARCFGKPGRKRSGKRTLLDSERVFVGDLEGWKRLHKHFINVRDKHLAHSVNPFEINRAGLFVEDWGADPSEHAVGVIHVYRGSDTTGNVLALVRLAEIAMDHAYERSDALLAHLHGQVNALSAESLRDLDLLMLKFRQGEGDVSGPR